MLPVMVTLKPPFKIWVIVSGVVVIMLENYCSLEMGLGVLETEYEK